MESPSYPIRRRTAVAHSQVTPAGTGGAEMIRLLEETEQKMSVVEEELRKVGHLIEANSLKDFRSSLAKEDKKLHAEYAKIATKKISNVVGDLAPEIQEVAMELLQSLGDLVYFTESEGPTIAEVVETATTKI